MQELVECPFCSSNRVAIFNDDDGFYVHCSECSARGSVGDTKKEAEIFWNERA